MRKIKEYAIEDCSAWINVHCRFRPNEALLTIIEALHGVEKVVPITKYTFTVVYGKMFTKGEITRQVAEKLDEYIYEIL